MLFHSFVLSVFSSNSPLILTCFVLPFGFRPDSHSSVHIGTFHPSPYILHPSSAVFVAVRLRHRFPFLRVSYCIVSQGCLQLESQCAHSLHAPWISSFLLDVSFYLYNLATGIGDIFFFFALRLTLCLCLLQCYHAVKGVRLQ
ncbi:hypothetical protein L208DRAFT_327182 [Tricholoma matsutake]|nr:hypothetical protein L208DRAFT_327182 [Tricholoma matsutake 945]